MTRLDKHKTGLYICVLLSASVATFGQHNIEVGPNVQISKANPLLTHTEVQVSTSVSDSAHLLSCSIVTGDKSPVTMVYASRDGGLTWAPTLVSSIDGFSDTDPSCEFGTGDNAYFSSFGWAQLGRRWNMRFFRSSDGGRTWLPPVTNLPLRDREFITVDRTKGKYNGTVYLYGLGRIGAGDAGTPNSMSLLTVLRSMDGGDSFGPPVYILPDRSSGSVTGTNLISAGVVLSNGALVILVQEQVEEKLGNRTNRRLRVVWSEDGGWSFPNTSVVSDAYFLPSQGWNVTTPSMPSMAVDGSSGPFHDRIYATWTDEASGRARTLLSYSSDRGRTWSKPFAFDDDLKRRNPGRGPDDFMPTVAVNVRGVVGLMWYDRRDNPDNIGYCVRFSASLDGGETFSPSVKVSEACNQHLWDRLPMWAAPDGGGSYSVPRRSDVLTVDFRESPHNFTSGETAGLAADVNGVFHPVWIDDRTGVPQIWTAAVKVVGQAIRHGSEKLEKFEDITNRVTLEFSRTQYQRSRDIVSADVHLVNTSNETLVGPLKLRILSVESDVGLVEILNSDNHETKGGALWDFGSLLGGQKLPPGEQSLTKRLEFRVQPAEPMTSRVAGPGTTIAPLDSFVRLRAQILGFVERPTQ